MKLIRKQDMKEGRWRNGLGISWDIAAWPEDAGQSDFGWRFATALIETDVAFSVYPEVDRYFTLLDGAGLDLELEGVGHIAVDRPFVPHHYPCDVPTFCRLRDGSCRALNLFLKRGQWSAAVNVLTGAIDIRHDGPVLVFALDGDVALGPQILHQGDAAVGEGGIVAAAGPNRLYVARLSR